MLVTQYIGNGEYDEYPEVIFKESKRRIEAKKEQIKDLTNELGLLKQQSLSNYRKMVRYDIPIADVTKQNARIWLKMIEDDEDPEGNKLDKRKKYIQKEAYDQINDQVSKLLGIDVSVTNIIDFNFGQATIFEFIYKNDRLQVVIPNINRISMNDFTYYGEDAFKLKINFRESEIIIKRIGTTFEENDLKRIIEDYYKEDK